MTAPASALASPPESEAEETSPWQATGRVRLDTLILVRWMAIGGQTAAVLFIEFILRLDLQLGPTLSIIALSAWVNLFLMIARPTQGPVREWEAAAQLAYDIAQLAVLLGLTGGVANPFTLLLLAPVAVSAAVLRRSLAALLAVLTVIVVAVLTFWHAPLPWHPGRALHLPDLYLAGMATAVIIGILFISLYGWRVATEENRMTLALAATESVLAREQRLSALGALAAAAAHELGTPLATIHLVAKEMARTLPKDSPLMEDAQLLVQQSERCRAILTQLGRKPETGDVVHARMPLQALLEEAAEPHRGLGAEIRITLSAMEPLDVRVDPPPTVKRLPEILHGLGALIENAVGFADAEVEILARWSAEEIIVSVRDDGQGFPPDILPRLGSPFLSARGPIMRGKVGGGMGLGFFIAKTLLERSGGAVEARNRAPPRKGAVVRVIWARAAIEAPPI
ncbi:MAG: ActS/PrrB/RegB family redox-sensitive histidine kinase [Hyphomonadaceae bacterium]